MEGRLQLFINMVHMTLTHPVDTFNKFVTLNRTTERMQTYEEVFIRQEYNPLRELLKEGTTVIDIGANIGDTAVYFAMSDSVKSVHAFEPIPSTYSEAKRNVESAPTRGKITLYNKAVGAERSSKQISSAYMGSAGTSYEQLGSGESGVKVEQVTLNEVLKGKTNVAIKCDCEGAERTLFNDADLSNVYAMQIEYHQGCLGELEKVLKGKGFETKRLSGDGMQGLILAKRAR